MFSPGSLTFILGEVIFLLLVCSICLIFITTKLKREKKELEEEYKELRKRTRQLLSEADFAGGTGGSQRPIGDPVANFLHSIAQYSIDRFNKMAPGGIPNLAPDVPFGAKVAALRYLVAIAEAENRAKQNAPENWLVLEKKLADVVRWVRNMPKQPNLSAGRIKQLQEKIAGLKQQEVENSRLKRQLTIARNKGESLTEQNKSQRDSIRKLQTMVNAFQRALPDSMSDTNLELEEQLERDISRHERAAQAYEGSIFQVNNINDISKKKHGLLTKLAENLDASLTHLEKDEREEFERKVKALEVDILKSDHHITNLQQELKIARDNIDQLKRVKTEVDTDHVPIEEDINADDPADAATLEQQVSWVDEGGPQRSLDEIDRLRANNQNQRKLILELNAEINVLREAMLNTEDEALKEAKGKDIVKLERLVKECEYCIEALESEVELLREQMTDEQEKLQHPDVQQLNRDIEKMSSRLNQSLEQYSHASIINSLVMQLLDCENIESIAQLLATALNSMGIAYGFYLNSDFDKLEYYSDGKGSALEQKSLKATGSASVIGYTNEGILFFRPYVRLIIRSPSDDDEAQALLETTLNNIVQLLDSKIAHLDAQVKLSKHDSAMTSALHGVHSTLSKILSLHHAQSNDAKSIIIDFIQEIEASVTLMHPSPAVKAVFENATSECYQRMDLMLSESKVIDKYTQDIISFLESK